MDENKFSKLKSALMGAEQGATLGFADELAGKTQQGLNALSGMMGRSPTDVDAQLAAQGFTGDLTPTGSDLYKSARDDSRQEFKQAKEANPNSYLAGELGGTAATSLLPVGSAAKAADLASAIKTGAVTGGLYGAGNTEKEGKGMTKDILMNAAAGGIGGGALKLGADKFGKLMQSLQKETPAMSRAGGIGDRERQFLIDQVKSNPEGVINPNYNIQKRAIEARQVARKGSKDIKAKQQNEIDSFSKVRDELAKSNPEMVQRNIVPTKQRKLADIMEQKQQMNQVNPEEATQLIPDEVMNGLEEKLKKLK